MTVRAFIPPGTAVGADAFVRLSPEEAHYVIRVRRARVGSVLELLDGIDGIHRAEVVDADPRACRVRILGAIEVPPTPPLELALALVDPKATLTAIERACEMAVTKIVLVASTRSHFGPPSVTRIRSVIRSAQRQCGRPVPPALEGPLPLGEWLNRPSPLPGFVASVRDRTGSFPVDVREHEGARLLVGPEGGLTEDEETAAVAAGLHPIGLSPWILRTETAVVAGLARITAAYQR